MMLRKVNFVAVLCLVFLCATAANAQDQRTRHHFNGWSAEGSTWFPDRHVYHKLRRQRCDNPFRHAIQRANRDRSL
jgi:hypothetical protein